MKKELSIKNKYYKYFPFKILVERIIKRRTKWIVDSFDNFIGKGERILDIGAGGGWISKEIQKRKKTDIILLDIADFNQTDLKLTLYNGKKIPFPDNSFDAVFLNFVLHHAKNPLEVLKEAKRVSRSRIVIFEDTYNSFFGKTGLYFWDIISNLHSFLVKPFKEKMSFNFKKVSEWEKIFKDFNLKIFFEKKHRFQKLLFILNK